MIRRFPRFALRLPLVLVAVALVLAAGGCRRWNWRGEGFGDDSGQWAQKLRPPADESRFSGIDTRSREIERDLGVR